jgi:hypothetical protein
MILRGGYNHLVLEVIFIIIYSAVSALCVFNLPLSQNPAVRENASITISKKEFVYPLYAEAAINATVSTKATTRLYATLVKSNTSNPGNISAAK